MIAIRAGVIVAASVLLGGGCAVGDGAGEVQGSVRVVQCVANEDMRIIERLTPSFFGGEPIDSATPQSGGNILLIRLQGAGGARAEVADGLLFYILDTWEVGRCMRGRTNPDGTADWNQAFCDRSTGEGRVLIGAESEIVRSFLVLNYSCPNLFATADGLGTCAAGTCPRVELCPGRGSWLVFAAFGRPPGNLADPLSQGFKVDYSERIHASTFHVEFCDSATVAAVREQRIPVPSPRIVGSLDGWFDFDLQRGQGAQPFP